MRTSDATPPEWPTANTSSYGQKASERDDWPGDRRWFMYGDCCFSTNAFFHT
jgi:hypothetical protein